MSTNVSPLAEAMIQGWKEYQRQLVEIIRPLTAEQLATRAAPNLRPISEIIAHIIAGRAFWFSEVLKEGDEEAAALVQWDDEDQPARTAAEYVHALEVTWNMIEQAIARWGEIELTEITVLPWIGPEHPVTRPFVVWHELEHDLHHGGEISHTLGVIGLEIKLPPPPPGD